MATDQPPRPSFEVVHEAVRRSFDHWLNRWRANEITANTFDEHQHERRQIIEDHGWSVPEYEREANNALFTAGHSIRTENPTWDDFLKRRERREQQQDP